MSRLASGGLIDRAQPHCFTFDGKGFGGFAGDTLASALLANDVKLVGRSFKYHRPRGIVGSGPRSRMRWSNCVMARGASPIPARRPPSFTTASTR